jgi:acyl CoA:acetate/3-ketoacid CoA transferase beta subunit
MLRHSPRALVERLDFVTSVGRSGDRARDEAGSAGAGPVTVITDLGTLRPRADDGELELTAVNEGVSVEEVREATGWTLLVRDPVTVTEPPSDTELRTLRGLRDGRSAADRGVG